MHWLLVTVSVVPSSQILVTLLKVELSSSETSVLARATQRNTPEDTILHLKDKINEPATKSGATNLEVT
jgi:hypothetical protein